MGGRTSKPPPQTRDCAFRITDSIPNVYSERLYELPGSLQDSLEFWQTQWRRSDCKSIQTETFNGNFGLRYLLVYCQRAAGVAELQKREGGKNRRGDKRHHPIEGHPNAVSVLLCFPSCRWSLVLVGGRRLAVSDFGLFGQPLSLPQHLVDLLQGTRDVSLSRGIHFGLVG